MILAFSDGGTRAAAFSCGVLEYLRQTEIAGPKGDEGRLLDQVDIITGASGGSFTALAYGLYADPLFDDHEQQFLKRNVQGEPVARAFKTGNRGHLWSTGWGRPELAGQRFDAILFKGATFGDLDRGRRPLALASATDFPTGSRRVFSLGTFDVLCSDLSAVRLSRAAATSSAVPVVPSAVTLNNCGGSCHTRFPAWVGLFTDCHNPPRRAARAIRSIKALQALGDGAGRPFIHPADRGVSDNVGMRSVLEPLAVMQALHEAGQHTPPDSVKRIVVFIGNSLSLPPTQWDESATPPGSAQIMLRAAGTPIDANSCESTEMLQDTAARWHTMRLIRDSAPMRNNTDAAGAGSPGRSSKVQAAAPMMISPSPSPMVATSTAASTKSLASMWHGSRSVPSWRRRNACGSPPGRACGRRR